MQSAYVVNQVDTDQEVDGGVRRSMESCVTEAVKAGAMAEIKILESKSSVHDSRDLEIDRKFKHDLRDYNNPENQSNTGVDQIEMECDDVEQLFKDRKRGWKRLVKGGRSFDSNETRVRRKRDASHVEFLEMKSDGEINPHGKRFKATVSESFDSLTNDSVSSDLEGFLASTPLGSTTASGHADRSQ